MKNEGVLDNIPGEGHSIRRDLRQIDTQNF